MKTKKIQTSLLLITMAALVSCADATDGNALLDGVNDPNLLDQGQLAKEDPAKEVEYVPGDFMGMSQKRADAMTRADVDAFIAIEKTQKSRETQGVNVPAPGWILHECPEQVAYFLKPALSIADESGEIVREITSEDTLSIFQSDFAFDYKVNKQSMYSMGLNREGTRNVIRLTCSHQSQEVDSRGQSINVASFRNEQIGLLIAAVRVDAIITNAEVCYEIPQIKAFICYQE